MEYHQGYFSGEDTDSWSSYSSQSTISNSIINLHSMAQASDSSIDSNDEESMSSTTEFDEDDVEVDTEEAVPPPLESPIKSKNTRTKCSPEISKTTKLSDSVDEEDGHTCTICFESWTNAGDHRLASLRCGHLFGLKCIRQWLTGKVQRCPQCNARARRSDIRVLFVNSLKVVDRTEQEELTRQLELEKEARRKAEIEAAQTRLKCQLAEEELARLKQTLIKQKPNEQVPVGDYGRTQLGLKLLKSVIVCSKNGCRVLAHHRFSDSLVISKCISLQQHGIAILNLSNQTLLKDEICCHSKPIRDLSVSTLRQDGLLLTASMDKSVCVSNILSSAVTQRYAIPVPVWSCTWSRNNPDQFFAGLQNGNVWQFDIRNTQTHVNEIISSSRSPVVSLQAVELNPLAAFSPGGLLVGQLTQISFQEFRNDKFTAHQLPIEGSLTSLSFYHKTRQLLASFRPSSKNRNVSHLLCEMTRTNTSNIPSIICSSCSCNVIHSFQGGPVQLQLSRSALLANPVDKSAVVACASDESKENLVLWDVATTEVVGNVHLPSTALDVCPVVTSDERTELIACLTSGSVLLFSNGQS